MSDKKHGDIYTIEINNYQEGKKIKISPYGEFRGMDGRLFSLSEATLVKTKENGVDIPLNVEHGYTSTHNSRAVGWITLESLELQEDGVYGLLSLNKEGKKLIEDKSYRYLSPEFILNQKREVITIEAVALTNTPNLKLEINDKTNPKENEVDPKENEAQIKELNEKLDQQTQELNQKDETIKQLEDELKEQAFNAALTAGKVLPTQKEFAMSLNKTQLNSWLDGLAAGTHMQKLDPEQEHNSRDEDLDDFAAQVGW